MADSSQERHELKLSKSEEVLAPTEKHDVWSDTASAIWDRAKALTPDKQDTPAILAGTAVFAASMALGWRRELGAELSQIGRRVLGESSGNEFLSAEARDLTKSSQDIARMLSKEQPQLDANGQLRYYFAGSLSMNLIASAGEFTELSGKRVFLNPEAKSMAADFVRKMHDVDLVVTGAKTEFPATALKFSEQSPSVLSAFKKPPSVDRMPVDLFEARPGLDRVVKVNIGDQEVFVTHPISMTGNKLGFALSNFEYGELPKLKGDFEKLIGVAKTLGSREEILQTAQAALDGSEPRTMNSLRAQIYDPNYTGPLRDFVDDLVAQHPENKWLQNVNLTDTHSLATLRLLGKMGSDADKTALVDFMNKHGDLIDKFGVNEYTESNRQLLAREVVAKDPEMIKELNLPADADLKQISDRLLDYSWVMDRAVKAFPNPGQLELAAKENQLLDILNSIDPKRVPQELESLEHLLPEINSYELKTILASPQAANPAFRVQLFDALKEAADNYGDMGISNFTKTLRQKIAAGASSEEISAFLGK